MNESADSSLHAACRGVRMTSQQVIDLGQRALQVILFLSAPVLLAGMLTGLAVSLFQAVTSIQEATLTFIPKILVTGAVVAIGGPWMISQMVGYTHDLYMSIPSLVGP